MAEPAREGLQRSEVLREGVLGRLSLSQGSQERVAWLEGWDDLRPKRGSELRATSEPTGPRGGRAPPN